MAFHWLSYSIKLTTVSLKAALIFVKVKGYHVEVSRVCSYVSLRSNRHVQAICFLIEHLQN